jgi:hypothetical protein
MAIMPMQLRNLYSRITRAGRNFNAVIKQLVNLFSNQKPFKFYHLVLLVASIVRDLIALVA